MGYPLFSAVTETRRRRLWQASDARRCDIHLLRPPRATPRAPAPSAQCCIRRLPIASKDALAYRVTTAPATPLLVSLTQATPSRGAQRKTKSTLSGAYWLIFHRTYLSPHLPGLPPHRQPRACFPQWHSPLSPLPQRRSRLHLRHSPRGVARSADSRSVPGQRARLHPQVLRRRKGALRHDLPG